jgi:drug/metabolite transporter (DMT)-like permease
MLLMPAVTIFASLVIVDEALNFPTLLFAALIIATVAINKRTATRHTILKK